MKSEVIMPGDVKITTELLYKGALIFALMDAVYVPLLAWRIDEETFRNLKWSLAIAAAFVWYGIWRWAIGNYWQSVYAYLFPAWAQRWAPWIAFLLAGIVALGMWASALGLRWNAILSYCLLGGLIGSLTHIWAVYLGVVTKPPMLQGASPLGAVLLAFFEYVFYWCTILFLAKIMDWLRRRLIHP